MLRLFARKTLDPFEQAINDAERRLKRAAEQGIAVPADRAKPILAARDALKAGNADRGTREAFYAAYTAISGSINSHGSNGSRDPFGEAVEDADHLLKYAAEMSIEVPEPVAADVIAARTALAENRVTDAIRSGFYAAYTKLAKLFGDATVDTIRNCSSRKTRLTLVRNRIMAVSITVFIATVSVITFVTDDMAKRIRADIASANEVAAKLRAGLTDPQATLDPSYVSNDPCDLTEKAAHKGGREIRNVDDVTQVQHFAATIRDLHSRAVKLNWSMWKVECDPYGSCDGREPPDEKASKRELQLNPAILNYPAEVLCKIQTLQKVRSFSQNVHNSYTAAIGAFAAHALPILYAWLGAYAFRLRLFVDTLRKRTYHPSFADSARMITAVIGGAIVSLFYPTEGASFSPLAIAFMVGYGVEIFFKFLDALINSLGSGSFFGQRAKPSGAT